MAFSECCPDPKPLPVPSLGGGGGGGGGGGAGTGGGGFMQAQPAAGSNKPPISRALTPIFHA